MASDRANGGNIFAYVLVFSVQVVFSAYQLLAKVALSSGDKSVNPLSFALIRTLGTTLALFGLGCGIDSSDNKASVNRRTFSREHMYHFVLLGVCMAGNVLGLIFALECTSSGMVAILQVLRPIFAGFISWAMGLERFSSQMLMGIALCILGTTTITTQQDVIARPDESVYLGAFFVCIHSLSLALYVVRLPPLLDEGYSLFMVNSGAFLVASLVIAPFFAVPNPKLHQGVWWDNSPFFIGALVYSIVMVGAYSYSAMGWAAKKIGATAVMLFMMLQAILTTTAGRFVLNEQMNYIQIFGGFLILAGILIYILGKEITQQQREPKGAEPPSERTPIKVV